MKKDYTPGPWVGPTSQYGIDKGIVWNPLGEGHGAVCTTDPHCVCMQPKLRDANVRLIVKAPEMADALEAALPYVKQCNISGCHVLAEEIEKIIKEIEG